MKKFSTTFICLFTLLMSAHFVNAQDDPYTRFVKNGVKLSRMQQYSAAIKEFDLAIAISDTSAQVYYFKGLAYFAQKDAENSIKSFEDCIKRDAKHVDALAKLITLYRGQKDLGNAIRTYDRMFEAVDAPKMKIKAQMESINLLLGLDSFDSALMYINKGLEIDEKNVELLMNKGRVLNVKEKYEEALKAVNTAIAEFEGRDMKIQTQLNFELGYALHKLGRYKESAVAFRNASNGPYKSKVAMFSPTYYKMVAQAHYSIYNYDEAKRLITVTLAMDSTFEEAIDLRDKIDASMKDKTKEVEAYKNVLDKDLDEIRKYDIYKTCIEGLISSKKYKDAVVLTDSCIALYEEKSEPYFMKSVALFKNNFKEDAVSLLEKLVKEPGHSVEEIGKYRFQLGLMYASKGETKKAAEQFDTVMKGSSNFARPAMFEKNRITGE